MRKYRGTEKGPRGVYVNLSTGEFVQLYEKAEVLPGTTEARYIRMPLALAAVTGPFIGLAFIIFLPFAGLAGLVSFIGYQLWRGVVSVERRTVQLAAVSWKPGVAFFSRHTEPAEKKDAKSEKELSELEKEITARKEQGEQ